MPGSEQINAPDANWFPRPATRPSQQDLLQLPRPTKPNPRETLHRNDFEGTCETALATPLVTKLKNEGIAQKRKQTPDCIL